MKTQLFPKYHNEYHEVIDQLPQCVDSGSLGYFADDSVMREECKLPYMEWNQNDGIISIFGNVPIVCRKIKFDPRSIVPLHSSSSTTISVSDPKKKNRCASTLINTDRS